MNTNKAVVKEEGLDLSEIVNEDWPMVKELSNKKYNINVKKNKVPEQVMPEVDLQVSNEVQKQDVTGVVSTEISQPDLPVIEKSVPHSINKVDAVIKNKQVEEEDEDINIKSFFSGLLYLFTKKTSSLLKPINFIYENFSNVSLAMIHLIVPAIMTYFLINNVSTVSYTLSKEPTGMYIVYTTVFYFASTFVWVLAQVLLSGIISMFKNAGKEVAKASKK